MLKGTKFNERASASADAKKAMLAKFQSRPSTDDPDVQKRIAERREIAEARAVRTAERDRQKQEAAALKAAEQEAARQAELAAANEQDKLKQEQAALLEDLKTKQKAARDARYAARKQRR
jgi:hypothetical protein